MKQVTLLNKELDLLQTNQGANPQAIQKNSLDVTKFLNDASSLLPQKSTTTSANKENAHETSNTTGARRGSKTFPRDPVTGKIETSVALLPAEAGAVLFADFVC